MDPNAAHEHVKYPISEPLGRDPRQWASDLDDDDPAEDVAQGVRAHSTYRVAIRAILGRPIGCWVAMGAVALFALMPRIIPNLLKLRPWRFVKRLRGRS